MSEIIRERLKNSVGKRAKIFLHNDFRYEGTITNCDDEYLEILDYKSNSYKIILISEIKDIDVSTGNEGVKNEV